MRVSKLRGVAAGGLVAAALAAALAPGLISLEGDAPASPSPVLDTPKIDMPGPGFAALDSEMVSGEMLVETAVERILAAPDDDAEAVRMADAAATAVPRRDERKASPPAANTVPKPAAVTAATLVSGDITALYLDDIDAVTPAVAPPVANEADVAAVETPVQLASVRDVRDELETVKFRVTVGEEADEDADALVDATPGTRNALEAEDRQGVGSAPSPGVGSGVSEWPTVPEDGEHIELPVQAQAIQEKRLFDPAVVAAAFSEVDEDDYLLLRLETKKTVLGEDIEGYRIPGNGYCLDLEQVARALRFPIEVDAENGTASGWFRSEDKIFELQPGQVRYGDKTEFLEGREVHISPSGLCIEADSIARWFDLDIEGDLSAAFVLITSEDPLPVELELERQRKRAAIGRGMRQTDLTGLPIVQAPYEMWRTPSVDLIVQARGNHLGSEGDAKFTARYNALVAGEALGASYDLRMTATDDPLPELIRLRAYRQDAEGRLFGSLQATEVVAGDVLLEKAGALVPASVGRGAYISNTPLARAADFDTTSFFGELPVGWEAELYRNGALVAFSEPSDAGRYEFREIPMMYGDNKFEIVLYGPQGQIRRQAILRRVGADFVPPGKTWFRAGIVQDGRSLIDLRDNPGDPGRWHGAISVEHGVSRSFSVGGAVNVLEDPVTGRAEPFAELTLLKAVGPALIELEGAANMKGGYAGALRATGRVGDLSLFASSLVQDKLLPNDANGADVASAHEVRAIQEFKLGKSAGSVDAQVRYETFEVGEDALTVNGRVTAGIGPVFVSQGVSWRQQGTNDEIIGRSQVSGRLGKLLLRGAASYDLNGDREFNEADVTASYRLTPDAQLRAQARYEGPAKRGSLTVGYAHRFDKLALGAEVSADTNGEVSAGLNLAMSIGPDGHGRFAHMSRDPLATRGQVAARVFTDLNSDGEYQEGEPLHRDARVTEMGRISGAETDDAGRAILAGLTSGRPTLIGVDRGSLDDPYLEPANDGVVIVPRRGVAAEIDIALLPTGEVEGTVMSDGRPRAGVKLVLRDMNGRVVGEAISEFDGFFLISGIPYGEYRIALAEGMESLVGRLPQGVGRVLITHEEQVAVLGEMTLRPPFRVAEGEGGATGGE